MFENDERVYSFEEVMSVWPKPAALMLHVPEVAIAIMSDVLRRDPFQGYIEAAGDVHINVMTQNICLLRPPAEFAELFRITPHVTQTTAHDRYTTQELSDVYQTPVHHLSIFTEPSDFAPLPYAEKENLIIYSPDAHPAKSAVLQALGQLPGYRLIEIRNMPYSQFENLSRRAKFSLSFREGFDGYFIRGFFMGAIGVAVYNDYFFPDKGFADLPTVFESYEDMAANLPNVINEYDDSRRFDTYVEGVRREISKYYSHERYRAKQEKFYRAQYDYVPCVHERRDLILELLDERDRVAEERDRVAEELATEVHQRTELAKALATERSRAEERAQRIAEMHSHIRYMERSLSWRITRPLRRMNSWLRQR